MYAKFPKLSITIDKILLSKNESKFGVNVNSECDKDIFYDAVNNSYDVASYSTVGETKKFSEYTDETIIQELNDILSDDANFFPCNEIDSMEMQLSDNVNNNNNENVECYDYYTDYEELSCSPTDLSLSQVSFSSLQTQEGNNRELLNSQVVDMECLDTFSTQIYTTNDIFQTNFICDGILDEVYLNSDNNDFEKNNLCLARELKVVVEKLSDKEISSYIDPKIHGNDKNNINNYLELNKELKIILKKMTREEILACVNANSSNKNINKSLEKELRVSLTKITDISKFIKTSELIEYNEYTTHDSGYFEEKSISIINNTINAYPDPYLLEEFSNNTNDIKKLAAKIDCRLDQDLGDILSPTEQNDYQQHALINSEDLDCNVHSDNKSQKTVKVQFKNNKLNYGKKRKLVEQNLENDNFQNGKICVYDEGCLLGFDYDGKAVYSNELIPISKTAGTILFIKNETIVKRSARIFTLTIYKIIFSGKYVINDNYKRTIENLGGKVVCDPKEATVMIAKKFKRTIEFLCAICRGIPIVSIDWIHECVENHEFVDPSKYLLKDTVSEKKYHVNLETSLKKAREKRIFEGYSFIITSGIKNTSFDQLKCLIELAGGAVFKKSSKIMRQKTILVSCPEDYKKVQNMMKKKPNYFERIVSRDFIIDCIMKQEIRTEKDTLN